MKKSRTYCYLQQLNCLARKIQKHYMLTKNIDEWNADPYFDNAYTDTETFSYSHYDRPKQVMVIMLEFLLT